MENISNWDLLKQLDQQFISNMALVSIFGETGNKALIVTNDDNVFILNDSNNESSVQSLAIIKQIRVNLMREQSKVKVNELCNKQIIDIAIGDQHLIALTKFGQCYIWDIYELLGNRTQIGGYGPESINSLSDKNVRVTAICCGSSRTLLLTNLGEVYSFDYNGQLGFGYNPNNFITVPVRVNGFNNEKIIAIACGGQHCLALSQSGRVFGWGNNNFGQLGFGQNVGPQNSPKLIELNAISIKQIACGAGHSLLLTTDGDVLAFGLNNFGQIGHKNLAKPQVYPTKVSLLGSNKFVDIASEYKSNISIAKSIDGFCYVWGESNGRKVYNPERTQFKSVFDAFVSNSKRKVTHKSMPLNVKHLNPKSPQFRIYESISGLFNDSKESDFKFKLNGNYIFVHKLLLKTRCEHFRNMFSNNWNENKTNEIEIIDYSYDVYYAFLKYIYTDSVDAKPEEVIELLDLANSYLEEDLKHKCIEIIKNGVTINNVCSLYSLAIKYESKELEDYCFEFASNKFNDICITDDFDNMDKNSMNKLVKRAAANKLFLTNQESYRTNHFPNAEFQTYDPFD